jgi:hypothetical protein
MKTQFLIFKFTLQLLLLLAVESTFAQSALNTQFNIIWEMQWQETGYLKNVYKWKLDKTRKLTYFINTDSSESTIKYIENGLVDIGKSANIEFVRMTDVDAAINLIFSVSKEINKEISVPCSTRNRDRNFMLHNSLVYITPSMAKHCAMHEIMHAMGLPGHPSLGTVLSYWETNRSTLHAIDRFVLRHWYTDEIYAGMNAFRVINYLTHNWVIETVPFEEQQAALQEQKSWIKKIISEMDFFADRATVGDAFPPSILYTSGRLTEAGIAHGRLDIHGILGVAHLEGYGTVKNPLRGKTLLLRGAKQNHLGSVFTLVKAMNTNKFEGLDVKDVCKWGVDSLHKFPAVTAEQRIAFLNNNSCSE